MNPFRIHLSAGHVPVTPTTDGYYFDVRLEIAPTNLAYTARALEFHTALSSEDAAPGVQFLHCRANTVTGGYSLFLDGAAAAEALREQDPAAFELLANHEITFFRPARKRGLSRPSEIPGFFRFLSILRNERFVNHFRLEGGSCIVFDNHRVVHSCEAFEATSGKRHLCSFLRGSSCAA